MQCESFHSEVRSILGITTLLHSQRSCKQKICEQKAVVEGTVGENEVYLGLNMTRFSAELRESEEEVGRKKCQHKL